MGKEISETLSNDKIYNTYDRSKTLKGLNFNGNFSVGSDILDIISDTNNHKFNYDIKVEVDNCSKKVGEITGLDAVMDSNTTTGNPYHLEAYFMDSGDFPIVEGLEKYRTVILETIFGYKIEMSVIGESHCIKITDIKGNIVASEIVACLPLQDSTHIYKLEDHKSIRYIEPGYDHKIMKYKADIVGNLLGTLREHGKDRFYSIQQDLLAFGNPQCSYDFPFYIEQEHNGKNHKIETAGITAIKAFSVLNENEKKIIIYSMHGYKQKGGLVYWDAPSMDKIIITRSIFDLNILGKK